MSGSVRAERSETDCTLVQPHRNEGLRPKSIPLGGDPSGYDLRLSRHDALFRVACVLVNGFALSDTEICSILVEYNAAACRLGVNAACVTSSRRPHKVRHCEPAGHLIGDGSNRPRQPGPNGVPRILGRITLRERNPSRPPNLILSTVET